MLNGCSDEYTIIDWEWEAAGINSITSKASSCLRSVYAIILLDIIACVCVSYYAHVSKNDPFYSDIEHCEKENEKKLLGDEMQEVHDNTPYPQVN